MTCISCKRQIVSDKNGFIVCPYCGTVNISYNSQKPVFAPPTDVAISPSPQPPNPLKAMPVKKRLIIVLVALSVCLLSGAGLALYNINKHSTNTASQAIPKKAAISKGSSATPQANSGSITQIKPANTPAQTPPACSKGTYSAASASNTPHPAVGLQQIADQPQHYVVYGYTATQIRTELNQCTPVTGNGSETDAQTNWWINFHYYWYAKSNGVCALENVGVVVHLTSIYPQLSTSVYTAAGLSSQWQTYLGNLTTHEQGHQNLALQYANALYGGLQNYPKTNCYTIQQSANAYANNEIAALNKAEVNYDSQTNHGATQGAIFP